MPSSAHSTSPNHASLNQDGSSPPKNPNWLAAVIILAITIAFGFFYYIFTHGTVVPDLGPVVGQ